VSLRAQQTSSTGGALSLLSSAGARSSSKLRRQLSAAVVDADPQSLRHLLAAGHDVDLAASFVAYPDLLHRACAAANIANVALLLRYGASVNTLAQIDR